MFSDKIEDNPEMNFEKLIHAADLDGQTIVQLRTANRTPQEKRAHYHAYVHGHSCASTGPAAWLYLSAHQTVLPP